MNDLAERALQTATAAGRAVLRRPGPWLSGAGLLAAAVVVVVGGRIGAAPAAVPLDRWLGLLPLAGYRVTDVWPGLIMLAGVAALAGCWLLTLAAVRGGRLTTRALWAMAAAWGAPFVVGPPLLSTDAYRAAARGLLSSRGLSPYHHGPAALGAERVVAAIDPVWRTTRATAGPVSVGIDHLLISVAASSPVAAVLLLRALQLAAVVGVGVLATRLSPERSTLALTLTVLNPATLLLIVSGAHDEGVALALLLGALVHAQARRWAWSAVLACLAAGVLPVLLAAVPFVLAAHAAAARRDLRLRVAARDLAVAAVVLALCALIVPYGLGWAANLGTVTADRAWYAPASLVSDAISAVVPPASFDDLAAGGRIATVLAAVIVGAYLLVTVRARTLPLTVGYALLAAGLLGPVVHPSYLLWGVLCLAPVAAGALRDWVVAISAAACVVEPVGFATRTAQWVTAIALAVIAGLLVPRLVLRARRDAAARAAADGASEPEADAGVTAAAAPAARRGPARA